jgi:hypothetical protein
MVGQTVIGQQTMYIVKGDAPVIVIYRFRIKAQRIGDGSSAPCRGASTGC